MSSDSFIHLHVASGYSLRHGTSHPHMLVQRAAEYGMDSLALTDRDGVYGAVKFAKACQRAGIRPIFGVDLAVEPSGLLRTSVDRGAEASARRPRAPVRGGASVDPRHPRVTLLARAGRGWAALCRLVSATHLRGERGSPVSSLDLIGEHIRDGGVFLLLGPGSELGRALAVRRPDLARAVLQQWREAAGDSDLLVEVASHRGEGENVRAARMLGLAAEERVRAVLTNVVRCADRSDAATADVLDAARRLVALDLRHIDRVNAEGYLKGGKEMYAVADEVATAAGVGSSGAVGLLATTRQVAEECVVDPYHDLGLGQIRFPDFGVVDNDPRPADAVLRERCEAGLGRRGMALTEPVRARLEDELAVIRQLGYSAYFLTVADVVALIRDMSVRVAARGSGAGSLVNYLLDISGVDPIRHDLMMERFLSPLRGQLPDIDIDVESARRTEIYEKILARYGGERCTCVSMMDTYRVRHAIRDVGAALGLPSGEIDMIAKAFPHIRARDARLALRELPELRASGIAASGGAQLDLLFRLVERLDGLPRHVALHPCGVLLSDLTLLDRTPVEASWLGFPMSQFDKDDVEDLGLLKLDVLGIRMQSAMAHAVEEVVRVDGERIDLDAVQLDDPATFQLIQSTRTLGCFQIESPGQRELIGKFAPETFGDLIIDISLFRPGPVKSDMVTPFLEARQGWRAQEFLHPDLEPALRETCGVVVFHEQVVRIVAVFTGCSLAEADEVRRALGSPEGQPEVEAWFRSLALAHGYDQEVVDRVWEVLKAFASFGFCKAHAAAFALPTYHSAWLKAHHPAAFLAGVLTHDPGMYPKRLILDDARQVGIVVLPLDVNRCDAVYRVEKLDEYDEMPEWSVGSSAGSSAGSALLAQAHGYGIRLSLAEVKGISDAEVARIVAGRPYGSLADFWHRSGVSRPIVERLVMTGAFDSIYGISTDSLRVPVRRRGRVTRRDLLLQTADLDRWSRATARAARVHAPRSIKSTAATAAIQPTAATAAIQPTAATAAIQPTAATAAIQPTAATAAIQPTAAVLPAERLTMVQWPGVAEWAARQSQAARPVAAIADIPTQLALDLGDAPDQTPSSGLPDLSGAERVRTELEVLGLDVSRHVVDFYVPLLDALGVTRSRDLMRQRSKADLLVAGVKVATQTPPVRSGRRVIFVTLDDATGPVDATFFEDAQGPYAATVFHSWLLVVRGELRRTGPRGVSLRATGCWELPALNEAWESGGLAAVAEVMAQPARVTEQAITGAAESRSTRPVMTSPPVGARDEGDGSRAGGMGGRRVLVHPSGFRQSPYADIKPPGGDVKTAPRQAPKQAPRKLWHSSSGSAGR